MSGIGKTIGSVAGSFLGGPVGGAVGNFLGGGIDRGLSKGGTTGGGTNSSGVSTGGAIQSAFGSPGQLYNKNPDWLNQASQDVYNKAAAAASQPYQAYTGEQVAPLTSNQTQAGNIASQQQGRFGPQYANIKSLLNSSATPYGQTFSPTAVTPQNVYAQTNRQRISTPDFTQANITGYMNPYVSAALQPQLDSINQDYATRQNQLNQKAAGSGNFGGSRQALLNSQLYKQQQDELNGVRNQGYNTAFNNAQNTFETDQSRNLQGQQAQAGINQSNIANNLQSQLANQAAGINTGEFNSNQLADAFKTNYNVFNTDRTAKQTAANDLTNVINQQGNQTTANINNLLSTGGVGQQTQQAQDTANYNNFLQKQGYPAAQAAYLSSILAASPAKGSISNGQNVTPDNGYGGLASAATSLLGNSGGASSFLSSLFG